MVFDDFVFHYAHPCFRDCLFRKRNSRFVSGHCRRKEDFINLLLCVRRKETLCFSYFNQRLFQRFNGFNFFKVAHKPSKCFISFNL